MCIYCNLQSSRRVIDAGVFLCQFAQARDAMKAAEGALLRVADDVSGAQAKRYRSIQKKMARLRREWARLEHGRELTLGEVKDGSQTGAEHKKDATGRDR